MWHWSPRRRSRRRRWRRSPPASPVPRPAWRLLPLAPAGRQRRKRCRRRQRAGRGAQVRAPERRRHRRPAVGGRRQLHRLGLLLLPRSSSTRVAAGGRGGAAQELQRDFAERPWLQTPRERANDCKKTGLSVDGTPDPDRPMPRSLCHFPAAAAALAATRCSRMPPAPFPPWRLCKFHPLLTLNFPTVPGKGPERWACQTVSEGEFILDQTCGHRAAPHLHPSPHAHGATLIPLPSLLPPACVRSCCKHAA